ncbi:MAG: AarF/UbiB family protein, partial [Pseudomonadota bacterium]|nr:AarF/UbiB family protein [Pseudomonadota bacterium]
ELSTAKVMTLDRIYGIPVTDTDALKAHGIDLKLLAERGVEIFFTQVFRHNFFHADMHPGNIFVSPDHIDPPQYQAIDCAIAGSLSRADQMLLAQLALLVLQKDYGRIVRLIVDAGWVNPQLNLSRLESQIQNLADPIFEQPLDQIEFAPLLMDLLGTVREFQMEFPTQY